MPAAATVKRTPPPDLEFRSPDCPFCNLELACDSDSFWCETEGCGRATWDRHGESGEWEESEAPQCESTVAPFRNAGYPQIADETYRCVYEDDHDGKHNHPDYREWTDESEYLVEPPKRTTGLVTIQLGPSPLNHSIYRSQGSIHLVRTEGSASKEILCGINRFSKNAPGWSIGGGTTPTDDKPCDTCRERARTLFAAFTITGTHRGMFAHDLANA